MDDEKPRLVANLGDKNMLILRNHGLLACGRSIAEAFQSIWAMQRACEVQVAGDSTGKHDDSGGADVLARTEQLMTMQSMGQPIGELEFAALTRIIEKIDPSFKE